MSTMNFSSSIAQRTRARKLQHFLKMVEKGGGSSTPGQATKRRTSSSGKVATISQMKKETNTKKRKSDKMISPTSGRTIISKKKRRADRKMNIALKNRYEDNVDDIEEIGEIFVNVSSNQVEDDIKIAGESFPDDRTNQVEDDVHEEKTHDVIQIDDSLSDEVEAEENDAANNHFDNKKNPKIFISTPGSTYFPKEDDDMVILGEEKGHDPRMLFKGKPGSKQKTNDIDNSIEKDPKISKNIAQSSSFPEGGGKDSEDQSQTKTAEGMNSYASEDSTESVGQKNDSTDSSDTENDDSSDRDFDMGNYNSSDSLDSLSSYAEESVEDYYTSNKLSKEKKEEKTTEKGSASYYVLKRRSSENHDKEKSTVEHNDYVYKRGGSASGSKDKGFDRIELKEMETSGGSRQKRGSIAQESSEEVTATKVIRKVGESENVSLGSSGVDEKGDMEGENSKKGGDLRKSTAIKLLDTKEDSKGERANRPFLKEKELTDMERKKIAFPIAPVNSTDCTKFCQESCALSHKVNGNIVDTQVSERKATVGKDEANEPNHAEKATGNKPNAGAQIEKSVTKRRYSILMGQQKYRSSTSLDEGRNNSTFKEHNEKQSEVNHTKKATRRKANTEAASEESVTKRRYSISSRQQKCHSSTSLDEGRKVCSPLENLSEKQSEDKGCNKEEESAWFAEKRQVHVKKDKDFFEVLAHAILREEEVLREAPIQQQAKPSSSLGYSLPLKFRFEDEAPKVPEKSEYENMEAGLFSELENNWTCEIMDTFDFPKLDHKSAKASTSEAKQINSCSEGKHDLVRNEEIGDICRRCHRVVHEIRDILPDLAKNAPRGSREHFAEKEHLSVSDGHDVSSTMENIKESCKRTDGTVWNIVPGLRESLYKHQQDGFEFLWKNLAGTTDLTELKNTDPKDVGGCIISHAPGTGKTRLSIVFIQSYLRLFADSRPVIIAPASMLLTWEEEFKKWEVEFPFHNLCNPEFSGKESKDLLKLFTLGRSQDNNKVRWVKIYSWRKEKSILGISYNLYEKLAGEKVAVDEESQNLRRILLQLPKLVVLDEGHIPRNQSSSIWKTLSKLQTEKRIILSGTPFQNNFDELFNTLHLVRPGILEKEKAFAGVVSSKLRYSRKRGPNEFAIHDSMTKDIDDKAIEKLKDIMESFVHVHKGSILQKSLPGLVDCMILLDPQPLQKSLIKKIEYSENSFELGYKVALLSVHPSLVENLWSSEYEDSEVNQNMLKELRLDSEVGVKTKFIMALIQFSTALNEKVLIFSQYIHPLELIKDQLRANFDWYDGKEVLQMQGKQDQLQRQSIISIFNNPNSEAKVLLAATRCCSEGISLVGASRVVLLDVVWNPSVERQAISRAYRLGQKKVVYTYHLITSGTNEGDKYCRQAEKDRLSELVFSSASNENDEPRVPTATFEDRILEKMVNHVELKDMFLKIISKPKETNLVETFGLVSPA